MQAYLGGCRFSCSDSGQQPTSAWFLPLGSFLHTSSFTRPWFLPSHQTLPCSSDLSFSSFSPLLGSPLVSTFPAPQLSRPSCQIFRCSGADYFGAALQQVHLLTPLRKFPSRLLILLQGPGDLLWPLVISGLQKLLGSAVCKKLNGPGLGCSYRILKFGTLVLNIWHRLYRFNLGYFRARHKLYRLYLSNSLLISAQF